MVGPNPKLIRDLKTIRRSRIHDIVRYYEQNFAEDFSARPVEESVVVKTANEALESELDFPGRKQGGKFKSKGESPTTQSPEKRSLCTTKGHGANAKTTALSSDEGPKSGLSRQRPIRGPKPILKPKPILDPKQVIELRRKTKLSIELPLSPNVQNNRISTLRIFYEENDRKSKLQSQIINGDYLESKGSALPPPNKEPPKRQSSQCDWTPKDLHFS
eukprot:maker-scaffold365_size194585-snap-gene-0.21 protein:Tk02276 transcript:maker-scaffold365_size194585-snap-gene-0.21-mRNA-1 annotation:"---NA---"